jgi:predicted dehydrogenase
VLTRPSESATKTERLRTAVGDYRRYYENVRDAIRGTAPLAVTAEQATTVIRLIELALVSSREGRTVPALLGRP